jgi:aerotaxis receptor
MIKKEHFGLKKDIDKYVIFTEMDKKGVIKEVSEAFCKISGYSKTELVGKPIEYLKHPDMSKKFYKNMWNEILKGKEWEGEIKNIDKNGNSFWVKGRIVPIFSEKKELVSFRSIRV